VSSFPEKTKFFYACKALTNINILKYVDELARMGTNIKVEGNTAMVIGVTIPLFAFRNHGKVLLRQMRNQLLLHRSENQ